MTNSMPENALILVDEGGGRLTKAITDYCGQPFSVEPEFLGVELPWRGPWTLRERDLNEPEYRRYQIEMIDSDGNLTRWKNISTSTEDAVLEAIKSNMLTLTAMNRASHKVMPNNVPLMTVADLEAYRLGLTILSVRESDGHITEGWDLPKKELARIAGLSAGCTKWVEKIKEMQKKMGILK